MPVAERRSIRPTRSLVPEHRGFGTFVADEAFKEVAKDNGAWNWALVGPDPKKLPLSGGGAGSIDEMRSAIGNHVFSFGLLRLSFGTGTNFKTKFVYVEASNTDDVTDGSVSQVERGQAAAKSPEMQAIMSKYTHSPTKVVLTSVADCDLDHFLAAVKKTSVADADMITKEQYDAAMLEFREKEEVKHEEHADKLAQKMVDEHAPQQADVARQNTDVEVHTDVNVIKLRRSVKGFKEGDLVMVFKSPNWIDDGIILERANQAGERDGHQVTAHSVKVEYNQGLNAKWITLAQSAVELKPSLRPRLPEPKSGELEKETHNMNNQWNLRYCELKKGFLMWWECVQDAKEGAFPKKLLSMLGLKWWLNGAEFSIKCASSRGVIFCFRDTSEVYAGEWLDMLRQHAHFAEEMARYTVSRYKELADQSVADHKAKRASRRAEPQDKE